MHVAAFPRVRACKAQHARPRPVNAWVNEVFFAALLVCTHVTTPVPRRAAALQAVLSRISLPNCTPLPRARRSPSTLPSTAAGRQVGM